VPAASDTVNIAPSDGVARTVTYDVNALTLDGLLVDLTGAGTARTTFSMPANDLTVSFLALGSDGRATLDHSGGTITTEKLDADSVLGHSSLGTGIYNLSGTGVLSIASHNLYIGNSGSGDFNQTGGTNTIGRDLVIAAQSGSDGNYSLNGGTLSTVGNIDVGRGGKGTLTIGGGADVSNRDAAIGFLPGSEGEATVTGAASTWITTRDMTVGFHGTGKLTIVDGGNVSSTGNSFVGGTETSTGDATVTGAGSIWTMKEIFVGSNGKGTLKIADGGSVSSTGTGHVGFVTSAGEATVTGVGSTWTTNGIVVGRVGPGMLTITDGGSVSSVGEIAVGEIVVGDGVGGNGTLTISNGGSLSSTGWGIISKFPGSTGKVTVTGANSTWNVGADLCLCSGGATLNIEDHALIHVTGSLNILKSSAGMRGIVNLSGGTFRFNGYRNDGTFNFHSGTIQLAGNRTIGTDVAIADLFGESPTIPMDKGLTVEGIATLNTGVTLDGGTLTVGELVTGSNLWLKRGTLNIKNQALTVGSAGSFGPTLIVNPNMTINVTNQATIDAGAEMAVFGQFRSAGLTNRGDLMLIDTTGAGKTLHGSLSTPAGSTVTVLGTINFADPVSGAGQFFGPGTANFNGGYNPGNSPAAVGFEGDVGFGSVNTLQIELGGTTPGSQYDRLSIAGGASLNGALNVSLINGFTPSAGQSFNIFDWGSVSGTFSSIHLPSLAGLNWNMTLLYTTGELSVTGPASLPGDFNVDGAINAIDIDLLAAAAAQSAPNIPLYDLNGDGRVTFAIGPTESATPSDSDMLIRQILHTQYGDADLNGQVFLSDLSKLATNYRQAGQFGWADGNFNGSQEAGTPASPRVFLSDLSALATNWRFGVGSGAAIAAIPEPRSLLLAWCGLFAAIYRRVRN
jgi:T5SS/PEP-CTERM-associated repeat protein